MNLQQYVLNNPINWVDPSGLDLVVFKDEGIHFGVAVDTSRGVYRIDLLPNTGWYVPIAITDIKITPWKGYPGKV